MSLPKTMENNGERRTSPKPNKLYINRNVFMRAIQKCTSYWIWVTMSKVVGIFVKFWHFLRCQLTKYGYVTWPKKQISKIFYFLVILHLILRKVTKFLVQKLSTSEVISQKLTGGGAPPVPLRLSWKKASYTCIVWSHEKKDSQLILLYYCSISKCYNFYILLCYEYHQR